MSTPVTPATPGRRGPRFHIGINNNCIGIYDSKTGKLQPPIRIPPLIYKQSSKLFRHRVSCGLAKPATQHNVSVYIRQIFQKLFVSLKLKQKQIASIVFVLNELDSHLSRTWIQKHVIQNEIKNVSMIGWKTALCMELLKTGKCKVDEVNETSEDGIPAAAMMLVFPQFYHLICLQSGGTQWFIKLDATYANDFSPAGFQQLKAVTARFDVNKFIVYHMSSDFSSPEVFNIFQEALAPAKVKFKFRNEAHKDMECLSGAVFKAMAQGGDVNATKYDVAESFFSQLRINCDNEIFHQVDVLGKRLPLHIEGKFECKSMVKQLSVCRFGIRRLGIIGFEFWGIWD